MITGMPRIAIAVEDYAEVMDTFGEKLGMPVFDLSAGSVASLGAKVGLVAPSGGSNIEIMSPGNPDTPLSQSVQSFLQRRGQGHFALMLEAADPDLEAARLLAAGLNVMPRMEGAGGRDVHPGSTHGVLIRVYPVNSILEVIAPAEYAAVPAAPLSGIQRVLIAVRDIDTAVLTYGEKFGLEVGRPVMDTALGVRVARCTPPSGGAIELVAVADAGKDFSSAIGAFLESKGEGIVALVLSAVAPAEVEQKLADSGIAANPVPGLDAVLELDQRAMGGGRFWIEGMC